MSFRDAARRLNRMANDLRRAEEDVIRLTTDDLYETAQKFSSGQLQPKDLARMDHPFAKRHGSPRLNPGFINEKTGTFKGSWRMRVRRRNGGTRGEVFNIDPKAAKYLEPGTRLMFRRSIDELIRADVAPRWRARLKVIPDRLRSA